MSMGCHPPSGCTRLMGLADKHESQVNSVDRSYLEARRLVLGWRPILLPTPPAVSSAQLGPPASAQPACQALAAALVLLFRRSRHWQPERRFPRRSARKDYAAALSTPHLCSVRQAVSCTP